LIPDKRLADLIESLIAFYYLNYNKSFDACTAFLYSIGILEQPFIKIQNINNHT
jgi:hypothetical protein